MKIIDYAEASVELVLTDVLGEVVVEYIQRGSVSQRVAEAEADGYSVVVVR